MMAAKPDITLARWAETAGGTPASNIGTVSSGQRDTGWALNALIVSTIFNTLMRQFYLWCKYLSDQIFSGDVTVTGGDLIIEDDIQAGQNIELVGELYHGDRELLVSAINATGTITTAGASLHAFWNQSGVSGAQMALNIPLREGDRIKSVTFHWLADASVGNRTLELTRLRDAVASAVPGSWSSTASFGSGGGVTLQNTTIDGTDYVVRDREFIFAVFTARAASVSDNVYGLTVVYDRPAP
jgi:hypothetical protein